MAENLWTGFNGRKLAAERAKKDWNGNTIVPANDSTITIKVADETSGPTAGSFTTNQSSTSTITIPAAASAPSGGSATPGVMSAGDKEKLDKIVVANVEDHENWGHIKVTDTDGTVHDIDVYEHPTDGANTSAGDTTAQTPGFGGTFKALSATVDRLGHTTALTEHTVTIPAATAVASESGTGGSAGLMSATDKEKLDSVEAGAQVNITPDWNAASGTAAEILNKPEIPTVNDTTITVAYGASSDSFTTNAATAKTITIPTAASASGSTGATGGLMSDTDKENLDWLTSVTPSSGTHAATSSNTVVTQSELAEAIADFGGYEVANGTGADMHPDVQNPSTKIIYLVKDDTATGDDRFNEWIYHGTPTPAWQLTGTTSMDMSGYAKIPAGASQNHVVLFGTDETLVDSGKVISDLENVITGISVNGTAQTPTNKVVDITVPVGEDTTTPHMDGTAAVGTASTFSRSDHVHPSDTSKQDVLTFNTAYDASTNKAATMADIADGIASKADKVSNPTDGHLAGLDTNGNLTDSGVDPDSLLTGVKLEGAASELTPVNGVVTIPNAVATTGASPINGLMTSTQATELEQIAAWTWSYASFDSTGAGTEQTSNFPFTVTSSGT